MTSLSLNSVLPARVGALPSLAEKPIPYLITAILLLSITYCAGGSRPKLPVLNPKTTTQEFMVRSKQLFEEGRKKFPNQPYMIKTYLGNAVVLPPRMLNEVKNLLELDFWPAVEKDHNGHLPGFEPFKANYEGPNMINRHLTKSLNKYTKPLYQEAKLAVSDVLTESPDWHEIRPSRDLAALVARTSARLFLGEELCRNTDWVRASSAYTDTVFQAVQVLRQFPPVLRPIANRLLPICKQTRAALKACRHVMRPVVAARQARKLEPSAKGEPEPVYDDALEWCQKEYATDRDPADSQISLAMVAIHPTTDQLTETMIQIARHPELFELLREEITTVLGTEGIQKTALYNLKLLDSVTKESQRLKPVSISNFRRVAVSDVTLSNGLRLCKGDNVWIDVVHMWDSNVWEDAEKFDPYRFVKLRGTEKDYLAHLVSTSPEHMGFGHGRQACPGRFFAAHEMKILLCHILLKYDWKISEGCDHPPMAYGLSLISNPRTTLMIRRREEELDLDQLEIEA
ncbi:cytochrome p450 [Colletotrichum musicola]|uniref:Cytochrome p450 n=1 Tax=Colletotrichum musicola TaxID=2175873 RepID=A0A8H6J7R7_9PEZI|nr:cytochrome p450 [Colletotrichum musicola]